MTFSIGGREKKVKREERRRRRRRRRRIREYTEKLNNTIIYRTISINGT